MRIGIVVKPGLSAARDTLFDLEQRLRDRGVDAVWSTEAAALLHAGARATAEPRDLPSQVDVVVVLGGDGTLLAMAKAIAESGHDIPILAVSSRRLTGPSAGVIRDTVAHEQGTRRIGQFVQGPGPGVQVD